MVLNIKDIDVEILSLNLFVSLNMLLFGNIRFFSTLSEFQLSENNSPFFTNLSIELFPDELSSIVDETPPHSPINFDAGQTDNQPIALLE